MEKGYLYVCQLSEEEQKSIEKEVREALQGIPWIDLEESVENAMNSKLFDLEDTINIKKYLKETSITVYGKRGNTKTALETFDTVAQAIQFCEQWGWKYDDGKYSYSMTY